MKRTSILSYISVFGGLGVILATGAHSQGGGFKNFVFLQPSSPGFSQSGHANISGTLRAGQFTGSGSGLTGLPWASIVGAPTSFPPNGTAGGDLNGTFPNPTVDGLQGRSVATTAPTSGQVLAWNGTTWAPTTAASGLTLPYTASQSSTSTLFSITNTGTGLAAKFTSTSTGVEGTGSVYGVSGVTGSSTASAIYGKSTFATAYAAILEGRLAVTDKAGFGTTSPAEIVHVVGNLRIDNGDIRGHGSLDLRPDIDNTGDDTIRFLDSAGSEMVRMDSNGNLGIGTSSALYDLTFGDNDTGLQWGGDGVLHQYCNGLQMLTVSPFELRTGRDGINNILRFGSSGSGEYIAANRASGLNLWGIDIATGGTPRLSVNVNGNVGIGTQSPDALLRVNGTCKVNVLEIAGAGDVAERFEIAGAVEPGTVVEIDPAVPGKLRVASSAYSGLVAGVISGAKNLRPGVILDPMDNGENSPVAMSGRVWVKCTAAKEDIKPGQLLVTSSRPGYAMAGSDRNRIAGAVIGKAMSSLPKGKTGLVLALVSLQ